MLFQSNGRKLQFRLDRVTDSERLEITRLITENGGEISERQDPPTFTFSSCKNYTRNDPVFHINYVRECIRREVLLDLIDFKCGNAGFYGCLMSLFICGSRSCSAHASTENFSPQYASTQIEPNDESLFLVNANNRLQVEHAYAHGDCNEKQNQHTSDNGKHRCHIQDTTEMEQRLSSEPLGDLVFLPQETVPPREEMLDDSQSSTCTTSSMEISIIYENTTKSNSRKINNKQATPALNINDFPLSAAEEEACEESFNRIGTSINIPCEPEPSSAAIPEPPSSPKSVSLRPQRSKSVTSIEYENMSMPSCSNTSGNPIVLRGVNNQLKIIGGQTKERFPRIANFDSRESDSDKTMYNETTELRRTSQRKHSPERSKDAVVSSTRSGGEALSISEAHTDSSSDDRNSSTTSRRILTREKAKKTQTTAGNANIRKENRPRPPTRNFSMWEQQEMVKYLIDNNCIAESRGNEVWKQMIHDGFLVHRTYQSLQNNFRRSVLPTIELFRMDQASLTKFKRLRDLVGK